MNKALFLDRDGVINQDHRYVNKIEDFSFMPGIFEITKHYQNLGYLIIVITNQAGISKGYFTENAFHEITKWMTEQFKQKGIYVDKVYYETSFDEKHPRRKPNSGMFYEAIKEFNINPSISIMIGDKVSDLIAAYNAGIRENYFLQGKYPFETLNFEVKIIHSLKDILN